MAAELTAFEAARSLVLEHASPLEPETVALGDALGRVLAEAVIARDDVPAFDNSAMDGFALRSADSGPGVRLRVVGHSRAGTPASEPVGEGEACAISTGAAMPAGADAVVPIEQTRPDPPLPGAGGAVVELTAAVRPGRYVRRAGDDIRAGATVLEPGVRLGPTELGVLASAGRATLLAAPRPRVAIVTTGDELVAPDAELTPGAVRNSSAFVIPALVAAAGGQAIGPTHAVDDRRRLRDALAAALEGDVAVVTGGMSVGEHDHVDEVLGELGVSRHLAGVALRPGKPFWFGTRGRTLVFGLPGNPVSSLVSFILLVRPALLALAGEAPTRRRTLATLDAECERTPGRLHAVRCRLELRADGWHASPTGLQESHVLTSMLGADALALIPAGTGAVAAGESVTVELL